MYYRQNIGNFIKDSLIIIAYTCCALTAVLSIYYSLTHPIFPETFELVMTLIVLFLSKKTDAKKLVTGPRSLN